MNLNTLDRFKDFIFSRRDWLIKWRASNGDAEAYKLGSAQLTDVNEVIEVHENAISNLENGSFGQCAVCHEDVETERLEVDFTTCVCLDHYSEDQKRLLEHDLELASKIQKQLLPSSIPKVPGIQLAAYTEPAQIVSGDYYDFFPYNDGYYGIAVADVMGKGLASSMLMANIQASIRILGPEYTELDGLVARLNGLYRYNLQLRSFISLFLTRINASAKTFEYCNAGHNPAIYWNNNNKSTEFLMPTGPAIGLTNLTKYEKMNINIDSGDMILIYTDGLTEARNDIGEEFGEQRLVEFIRNNNNIPADDFIRNLHQAALNFAGKFHDDITLILIKVI